MEFDNSMSAKNNHGNRNDNVRCMCCRKPVQRQPLQHVAKKKLELPYDVLSYAQDDAANTADKPRSRLWHGFSEGVSQMPYNKNERRPGILNACVPGFY